MKIDLSARGLCASFISLAVQAACGVFLLTAVNCSSDRTLILNLTVAAGELSRPIAFNLKRESEVLLHLEMWSDSDWAVAGRESAVLALYLDGKRGERSQDIVLFRGEDPFIYRVALGRLARGKHTVELGFDQEKSSKYTTKIVVQSVRFLPVAPGDDLYDAVRFSPVLYGRDDNTYTDTPLLMYHEIEQGENYKTIDYTVIWSNEDGGTNSPSLMSRWGRTTDIELICRVRLDGEGKLVSTYFQGAGHDTLRFRGVWQDEHPVLRTASLNNVLSDSGTTSLKFFLSPELRKQGKGSREVLMDRNPWTYAIMNTEMAREGKLETPGDPSTVAVSDARNYLYLEFYAAIEGEDVRLSFATRARGNTKWYYSDHADTTVHAVNRGGWRRSTVELPQGMKLGSLERLQLRAAAKGPFSVRVVALSRAFMLDETFTPAELPIAWRQELVLTAGNPAAELLFPIK